MISTFLAGTCFGIALFGVASSLIEHFWPEPELPKAIGEFIGAQKDIDGDIVGIVDKHFWDLVDQGPAESSAEQEPESVQYRFLGMTGEEES